MLPHGRHMIHQPLGGARGQATDVQIQANELLRWKDELTKIYEKHTGQPLDKLIEHNVQVPVNMGSDEAITMTQLADMLIKISGKRITKKYLPAGPAGCMRRNSDNTKIMKLTGWKPNYSLEQGLRNTFEYVKSQVLTK